MRQVTLVALYGPKAPELERWLKACQTQVEELLGTTFQPYDLQQLHATIVGLERSGTNNANFFIYRGKQARMNLTGLLNFLRLGGRFPFHIQLGGFQEREYPFTSWGQTPYHHSFSLQKDNVVLVGWPLHGPLPNPALPRLAMSDWIQESRSYPNVLDELRRAFQSFNALHKYHRTLTDVDNDFFLRLGVLKSAPLDAAVQKEVEAKMRDYLSRTPLVIEVGLAELSIVAYEDESLPLRTSEPWSLTDPRVTGELIDYYALLL